MSNVICIVLVLLTFIFILGLAAAYGSVLGTILVIVDVLWSSALTSILIIDLIDTAC